MIKCNVTVCGVVSKTAATRTDKEGKVFTAFAVNVVIPAKNGINKTIEVSITKAGNDEELTTLQVGSRIEVAGILTLKKRGEKLYFNLDATGINYAFAGDEDSIKGEMDFRGKCGKKIDEKTTKKGSPMLIFSAFSAEKVGDGFEYIWVRFVGFDKEREAWVQPSVRIEAKGELELSVYNDRLDIGCRLSEAKEYVQPTNEAWAERTRSSSAMQGGGRPTGQTEYNPNC